MNLKICPAALNGTITAPSSKSITHRAIICAALSNIPTKVYYPLYSDDTIYTINALEQTGIKFKKYDDYLLIDGTKGQKKPSRVIECGNSGSTFRLLMPLFSKLFKGIAFYGDKTLINRIEMTDFSDLGINYLRTSQTINVFDWPYKNEIVLHDNKTTQYISGLLLAAPLFSDDFNIFIPTSDEQLNPYIQLTIDVMSDFGIEVEVTKYSDKFKLFIAKNQVYSLKNYYIEGDYSAAANFMAMGTLSEKIIIRNLNKNSHQADVKMIEFLKKMKAEIEIGQDAVIIKKSNLIGSTFDITHCPDLGPILMALCSVATGTSIITGFERLNYKESNRVESSIITLQKLGVDISQQNNQIVISGNQRLKGGDVFDSYNDHRIVFMLFALSPLLISRILLTNAEAVTKSYPNFFEDFKLLGGIIFEVTNDEL